MNATHRRSVESAVERISNWTPGQLKLFGRLFATQLAGYAPMLIEQIQQGLRESVEPEEIHEGA